MNVVISIGIVLLVLWMLTQLAGSLMQIYGEWRKIRSVPRSERRNRIMIDGRVYRPKRMGYETDCKKECALYNRCGRGSGSICEVLNHPYDDVIMIEDGEE